MNSVPPWARRPFELIVHAEGHFRDGEDSDRGMALISFDNAIEATIATYLNLKPPHRGGRTYPKQCVGNWLRDYHSKLCFLESEIKSRGIDWEVPDAHILWVHDQRNDQYHSGTQGIPEWSVINTARKAALWIFSVLFDVGDIEAELGKTLQNRREKSESLTSVTDFLGGQPTDIDTLLRSLDEAKLDMEDSDAASEVSPIDRAVFEAVLLQKSKDLNAAAEKWHSIAIVTEGSDNDIAARAWFSHGYLHHKGNLGGVGHRSLQKALDAYGHAIRLMPEFAEAYLSRGNAKGELGRYQDAISDHTTAIGLRPDLAEAFYSRGLAKRRIGLDEEAIEDYDQAIRLRPGFVEAYINRGVTKTGLGRTREAIADYDRAIEMSPEFVAAFANRGVAKADLELYEEAIADYDRTIRLRPDFAIAYYNRGISKAALNWTEGAHSDFETALDLLEESGSNSLEPAIERKIRELRAMENDCQQRQMKEEDIPGFEFSSDWSLAYAHLEKRKERVEQGSAKSAGQSDKLLMVLALAEGLSLLKRGELEDAMEKWRSVAVMAEGSDAELASFAWYSVGTLFQSRGTKQDRKAWILKAVDAYDQAIRVRPKFVEAHTARGDSYHQLQEYGKALADYDLALQIRPKSLKALIGRGNVKCDLGRSEEAIRDYDRAIRQDQNSAEAHYERGLSKQRLGRTLEAIDDYDRAIEIKSDYVKAYVNRGNSKQRLGRHKCAVSDYDKAIHIDPTYALAYINRGNARAALGQHESAIADYDQSIRLQPGIAATYANRGSAKADLNRKEEAIQDITHALNLAKKDGDAKLAAKLEKHLEEFGDPVKE